LVGELRQLYVCAGVQLAIDMGQLIIERLFGGDMDRWRSRGRKEISFRKLEKHPDLPFRASTLSRAVSIYLLSKRRCDLTSFQHVSPSHLHEIAGLGEVEQDRLLERVESEKWSMRRLRHEVAGMVGRRIRHPGARSAFIAWVRRSRDVLESRQLQCDLSAIDHLELGQTLELLDTTRIAMREIEVLAKRLGAHIQELDHNRRATDHAPRSVAAPEHLLKSRASKA